MATLREITYMCLDQLKLLSDDAYFTEEHILFQIDKHRAFLLKQKYSDIKRPMPVENTSEICLDLIEVPAICGEVCEGGSFLRSKYKIPNLLLKGGVSVYPIDFYNSEITFVDRGRMRYIGNNKYLKNIIYCSIGPDGYIYFKSADPQFIYMEKFRMSGVFSSIQDTAKYACDEEGKPCDILDMEIPMENALITPLIDMVVNNLAKSVHVPEDTDNNAKDDKESMGKTNE